MTDSGQGNPRSLLKELMRLQRLMRFVGSVNPNRICCLPKQQGDGKGGKQALLNVLRVCSYSQGSMVLELVETRLVLEQDRAPESLTELKSSIVSGTYCL